MTLAGRIARIRQQIARHRAIQVRQVGRWLLTYPYPARRGYGTRGLLIAVYRGSVPPEWIEADLSALSDSPPLPPPPR